MLQFVLEWESMHDLFYGHTTSFSGMKGLQLQQNILDPLIIKKILLLYLL